MTENFITQFSSRRARRASGSARPVRASTLHDRRDPAAGCGVRPQTPAPPAPRLSACPPYWSRRRSRASFRPRISRASERTSHPVLPGWSTIARKSALLPARSCSKIVAQEEALRNISSAGAELRAELLFEGGNNSAAEIADLRVHERRFAALKRHAHEQRIFSGRNIFPAKKIRRLNRSDFRNVERLNDFRDIGEVCSIGEQQRKIAFDGRETRQG